ncbi:MAG: CsbD family protein [Phycisphaerales bacterium]|nr:CsbD family protein [Hyphomonadaceae bacterium]
MDKEHAKGAADKASGAVKEGIGNLTNDSSMKAKGKIDKAKGEAREALGDAKDAVRNKDGKH